MKSKKAKKRIPVIIGIILLVLIIQTPLMYGISKGWFAKGNRSEYSPANTQPLAEQPLAGRTVIFLGSSVTAGSASRGDSFVEYLTVRDGILAVEEAVSGTTLADIADNSYIQRLLMIDPGLEPDAFICQLSTNDASKKLPLGEISDSEDMSSFDTSTVTGGMEYIIAYVRETWGCPVIFYTGTKYDSLEYAEMVDRLLELKDKWGIEVIDLWNDWEMNSVSPEEYKLYMFNEIHPTRAGYRDWWSPRFEAVLRELLCV